MEMGTPGPYPNCCVWANLLLIHRKDCSLCFHSGPAPLVPARFLRLRKRLRSLYCSTRQNAHYIKLPRRTNGVEREVGKKIYNHEWNYTRRRLECLLRRTQLTSEERGLSSPPRVRVVSGVSLSLSLLSLPPSSFLPFGTLPPPPIKTACACVRARSSFRLSDSLRGTDAGKMPLRKKNACKEEKSGE